MLKKWVAIVLAISLALLVLLWCLSRRWYERKGAARV